MLDTLVSDGLPKFEARFKALLNENTIREIAGFQSQLYKERELIRERIAVINSSLKEIDYNPGRFIELLCTERDLFEDLLNNRFDGGVRLEQERVGYLWLLEALRSPR